MSKKNRTLAWISAILGVVAISIASFALGRLSARPDTVVLPTPTPTATIAPSEELAPQIELTPTLEPNQAADAQGKAYLLIMNGGALDVLCRGEKIATVDMPGALSEEIEAELTQGLSFSTLEEVEGWLESFDS